MRRQQALALAVLLASPLLAGAATNLISNGSFEADAQGSGSWSIQSALNGWSAGSLGVELRNGVAGSAFDGSNFIELDTTGNSWISQSFATTIGQTYALSFSYAQRSDHQGVASNGLAWSAGSVGSAVLGQDLNTGWTTVNASFVATGATTTLSFSALGSSDSFGSSLDKISVTAVPEPESYALMLVGLAAIGFVARRRKAG